MSRGLMVNACKQSTEHTANLLNIATARRRAVDNTPHLTAPSDVQPAECRGAVTDAHTQNGALSSSGEMETRRPVSRVLCRPPKRALAIIPLDRPSLDGSRDLPGPLSLRQPCRRTGAWSLFGLAPGGACHAVPIAGSAVRSYRTLSPLPSCAFSFEGRALRSLGGAGRSALCGAIPGVAPGGRYPPPCRRGARTFLPVSYTHLTLPTNREV